MQRRGKSVVTVVTNEFEPLARAEKEALGAPDHPLVVVSHPIGSLSLDELRERAKRGFPQLQQSLVGGERQHASARVVARAQD